MAIARRFVEAYNAGDVNCVLADIDPDVELHEWPDGPDARIYHGPDGVRQALATWSESWDRMHVDITELVEAGDIVVMTIDQRSRGRSSAIEVGLVSGNVYSFRGGKVFKIELFTNPAEAWKAAGLQRDNIDLVHSWLASYDALDVDAMRALAHSDLEIRDWPEGPDGRVYSGVDGAVRARSWWAQAWEHVRGEPTGFVDGGDRVLVLLRIVGQGRGSSIEVELDTFAVVTVRDGRIAQVHYFTDRAAAMAAAGLAPEQLRQEA
jgi:ketosteroid isomerase-like protein